jgi:hypothetical protein
LFRFVSVFRTYIETTETNRIASKRTETTKICSLSNYFIIAEGTEQVNSFGKEYQNKNKYSPETLSL